MTGRDTSRREQAQTVFFSVVMVLSVVAIGAAGFAGSAAADTSGLSSADAENITAGQESTTQQVTFDLSLDDGEVDRIYIDVSSYNSSVSEANVTGAAVTGTDNVSISSVDVRDATSDDESNASAESIAQDDRVVVFNVSADAGNNANGETITADLDVKSSGVTTTSGDTYDYTIESQDGGQSVSLSSNSNQFDVVAADSITVTEDNDNTIDYATDNVAQDGTVSVEPGTYDESVSITTNNVTLESTDGPENTLIESNSDEPITIGSGGDDIKNITIKGLRINNTAESANNQGIYSNADTLENFTLEDSIVSGSQTDDNNAVSLTVGALNDSIIKNNILNSSDYAGLILQNVKNVTVSNNTIKNTGSKGIQVADSSDSNSVIKDNTIENTGADDSKDEGGVTVYPDVSGLTVEYNEFINNSPAFAVRESKSGTDYQDGGVVVQYNDIDDSNSNSEGYAVANYDDGGPLDATSNWWGATNGPNGDFNGNGSAVNGDVTVDPASVDLGDGSVNLDQDFIGTVEDSQNVTLSDTSDATFSFDNESVPGEVDGTLVLGINGTEYVFKDALNEGEVNTSVSGAEADSGKNGTSIANSTPTGDTTITVVGNNSTTAVDDTGTIRLVHEVQNIGEGYELTSIPQPAEVYTTDVNDFTSWDNANENYAESGFTEEELVNSSEPLHKGQYAFGTSGDARVGYDFVTPSENDIQLGPGGSEDLSEGFHLVGSNYNTEGAATTNIDKDLDTVRDVPNSDAYEGNESFVVYDPANFNRLGGEDTVDSFDAYWVYVDEGEDTETRVIKLAQYDPTA